MSSRRRVDRIVFGVVDFLIAIVCVTILNLNLALGVSIIVLLVVRAILGTLWGIPWRAGKVDWSKRQPKPKTQVEERVDDN
jgi:hypothetical protein